MEMQKYSIGMGDRFGKQGSAQLQAVQEADRAGVSLAPVWNKSHREHQIVGTNPDAVRAEADAAVQTGGWTKPYYVDADHIGLKNVDGFLAASDFFTLDVADFIGQEVEESRVQDFLSRYGKLAGKLALPGMDKPLEVGQAEMEEAARKFLPGVLEAARIYEHIADKKGADNFVTEVSMDETDRPQTPVEMLFILAALADAKVPAQTVAPKFTGRFNKGVDYVGEVDRFAEEFHQDLCVVAYAVQEFGLPANLKLSVHSGSDKFSLYGPIRKALERHDAGLHLKTAGTTWLEELIGLALASPEGLQMAKDIYGTALSRFDELCGPYAAVIDIDRGQLPEPKDVSGWSGERFANALRHDQNCPDYDPGFRQTLHVAYKVAAEMGEKYLNALDGNAETVGQCVKENLLERHIRPLFL